MEKSAILIKNTQKTYFLDRASNDAGFGAAEIELKIDFLLRSLGKNAASKKLLSDALIL